MMLREKNGAYIPYLAAFLTSLITMIAVLLSVINYGIEFEKNILIYSLLVFFYWCGRFVSLARYHLGKTYKVCEQIAFIVVFVLISIYLLNTVWNSGYLTNDPIAAISASGNGINSDSMHHAAIVQALVHYKIPSLLVNSSSFYDYHFGSHILMAFLSRIVNIPAYYAYCFLYPITFFPLYIYLILSVSVKLKIYLTGNGKIELLDSLFVAWFIMPELPVRILNKCAIWKNSWVVSESFLVANVLALIYFNLILELNKRNWFDLPLKKHLVRIVVSPIFILFVSITKISVGFFLCIGIIYYYFRMHTKELRYWMLNIYYGVLFLAIYFGPQLIHSPFGSGSNTASFELFSFYRRYVQFAYLIPHFCLLYLFSGIAIGWRLCQKNVFRRVKEKKCVPEEILIIICLAGVMPGMLLNIGGGSAAYFSYVQQLAAVLLIIACDIPQKIFSFIKYPSKQFAKKAFSLAVVCCISVCLTLNGIRSSRDFKRLFANNLNNRLGASAESKNFSNWLTPSKYLDSKYMQIITYINRLTDGRKDEFYLFVDESAEVWNRFSDNSAALFFFPSMTGVVEIGAVYCENGMIFCNNNKEFVRYPYDPNPSDIKMTLDAALSKCSDDGKRALIYIYEDTFRIIQIEQ